MPEDVDLHYAYVGGFTPDALTVAVNDAIDDGWVPLGSPVLLGLEQSPKVYQFMTKGI